MAEAHKLLLVVIWGWIVCWPVSTSMAADRFVPGIADLPLMNGLEEMEGATLVFSKPQGRIVDTTVAGNVSAKEVQVFYNQTLPHLGWHKLAAGQWKRDNEILRLDVEDRNNGILVRFSLAPQ